MFTALTPRRKTRFRTVAASGLFVAALLGGVAVTTVPARAALTAYDGFDYASGASLEAQSGGTGWNGGWAIENPSATISATSLAFPALATTGVSLEVSGSAFRALPFPVSTGGGPVWFSLLISQTGAVAPQFGGLSLFEGTDERFFVGKPYEEGAYGFDSYGGGTASSAFTVDATPRLLVIALNPNAADTTKTDVYLFVNPDTASATPPPFEGAAASVIGSRNNFAFNRVRVAAGDNGEFINLDEVRIGTTFADVAPQGAVTVPEPSPLALFGVTGAAGLPLVALVARRRRRRYAP